MFTEKPPGPPITALLTPPARGAIAVIGARAANVEAMIDVDFSALNGKKSVEQPYGAIVFGHWGPSDGEEMLICRRGDGLVEIHCHGGKAVTDWIMDGLVAKGCRRVSWREWLAETEQNSIRREAMIDLAATVTRRAATILLDQLNGALAEEIAKIELELSQGNSSAAAQLMKRLLDRQEFGLHLARPWKVVIAGKPNVGKSSLVNAIVGYERAIVHDSPGTTRDVVTTQTAVDGWLIELSDTAGIRDTHEALEASGVKRTRGELASADQIVLVFEAHLPPTDNDQQLMEAWPESLIVYNKSDLGRYGESGRRHGIWASARRQENIGAICDALAARLVPSPPLPGEAIPFTHRQIELLYQAQRSIESGNQSAALIHLKRI